MPEKSIDQCKPCPECKTYMDQVLDKTTHHPTGAGVGVRFFRAYDLYKCVGCGGSFYEEGERVRAVPLQVRGEDHDTDNDRHRSDSISTEENLPEAEEKESQA